MNTDSHDSLTPARLTDAMAALTTEASPQDDMIRLIRRADIVEWAVSPYAMPGNVVAFPVPDFMVEYRPPWDKAPRKVMVACAPQDEAKCTEMFALAGVVPVRVSKADPKADLSPRERGEGER